MFPGDYAAQDQFFRDTAASAFESIVTNIGNVNAMDLAKQLADDVEHHRIYAWMANPDEQALMERFGAAGRVGNDPTSHYSGGSYIIDAKGRLLASDNGGEEVVSGLIEQEPLATFRNRFPVLPDGDDFKLNI